MSSVRFAVTRVITVQREETALVELLLLVNDVWCVAEFHSTSKRCTSRSSGFNEVVQKTSYGRLIHLSWCLTTTLSSPLHGCKLGQYLCTAITHTHSSMQALFDMLMVLL